MRLDTSTRCRAAAPSEAAASVAREGEQLAGEARRAVAVDDLLNVVIVDVAGRMAHQHEVAMADDGGQDIVEIMRDAARELADGLCIFVACASPDGAGGFPPLLSFRLSSTAASPRPRNACERKSDRTPPAGSRRRTATSPDICCPIGEAVAHRVGQCGSILPHDKVAGIAERSPIARLPRARSCRSGTAGARRDPPSQGRRAAARAGVRYRTARCRYRPGRRRRQAHRSAAAGRGCCYRPARGRHLKHAQRGGMIRYLARNRGG